eukprot:496496-Rhodomonas_salina.4
MEVWEDGVARRGRCGKRRDGERGMREERERVRKGREAEGEGAEERGRERARKGRGREGGETGRLSSMPCTFIVSSPLIPESACAAMRRDWRQRCDPEEGMKGSEGGARREGRGAIATCNMLEIFFLKLWSCAACFFSVAI